MQKKIFLLHFSGIKASGVSLFIQNKKKLFQSYTFCLKVSIKKIKHFPVITQYYDTKTKF